MVLTEEQGLTPVEGFTVYHTIIIRDLIEKSLRSGSIVGGELNHVATLYNQAIQSAFAAGYNISLSQSEAEEEKEQGEE